MSFEELEYRFKTTDRDLPFLRKIFDKLLENYKYKIIKSIALINNIGVINEVFFEDTLRNEKRIKKNLSRTEIFIGQFRVIKSISKEEKTDAAVSEIKESRIKYRYRFDFHEFNCDFTFIKSGLRIQKEIREFREKFFAITSIDELFAYDVELEFEAKDSKNYNVKTIEDFIKTFESSMGTLQNILGYKNSSLTLKKMLPSVIELNKLIYPELDILKYCITDKADGTRMILSLGPHSEGFTSDKTIKVDFTSENKYVFDCEYVNEKFYIFDIIVFEDNPVINLPFNVRWEMRHKFDPAKANAKYKKYYSTENLAESIDGVLEEKLEYDIDGIIFSSLENTYRSMKHYKWKPLSHLSIDFLCLKSDKKHFDNKNHKGEVLYDLCCSCSENDRKLFNLTGPRKFKKVGNLAPVYFTPSSDPLAYLYWHSGKDDLHMKIVELGFEGDNWKFMRVRDDRADDLANGYFGNYMKIAEFVWDNAHNFLTVDMLKNPHLIRESAYFQKSSEDYKYMRAFNNSIKRELIVNFSSKAETVLDLACGKGQDLFKFRDAGIKNMIMLDPVADSLSEIIKRKWGASDSREDNKRPFSVYTVKISLFEPHDEVLKAIRKVNTSKIDMITCNFAIHYLIPSKEKMEYFCCLVASLLTPGGHFIVTSLDGLSVFNLVKDKKYTSETGKFEIERAFTGNTFTGDGQKIKIKLPFSLGITEEYLVNYDLLTKIFAAYKFKLVKTGLFKEKPMQKLSAEEKEYTSMHRFAVYKYK